MRKLIITAIFALFVAAVFVQAEEKDKTMLIFRNSFDTARTSGSHLAEYLQIRSNGWIYPDIGYLDSNHPTEYREIFVGGGRTLVNNKHVTVMQEFYLDFASGPKAKGEMYFFPEVISSYRFGKVNGEAVGFVFMPLTKSAKWQLIIERIKADYSLSKRFKVGIGYGAYKCEGGRWQNKPFVYPGIKMGKLGELEIWLQEVPSTARVFVRYKKVF